MSNESSVSAAEAERRRATRVPRRESVSIQIMLPCLERSDCSRVVLSQTCDLSHNGLRLLLPEAVEAERILDLCVELGDNPRRFLLTGETRWCRHDAVHDCYEVGLLIHDGEGTDYREWAALFGE